METISVLVPIFNTGSYLKPCLDSIITQTYRDLEIILVNDGSTDGSAAICEAYAQKDSRIKVIHKFTNGGGVGASRNTALSVVTGDYILFVDHDDWLEKDHIELLYEALISTGSDIAITNFTQFFDEKQSFAFHIKADDYFREIHTPKSWFDKQYDGHFSFSQCFTVPWGKLYKASLFKNLLYPTDVAVEDDYTTWKIYLLADRLVFDNRATYYHRKLSSSITKMATIPSVYPLRSIEERVTLLSLIGFDIASELRAYRYRLQLHKEAYLTSGQMSTYYSCLQKLAILEKWSNQ